MGRKLMKLCLISSLSLLLLMGWLYMSDGPGSVRAISLIHYVVPVGQCGSISPCYTQVQAAVDAANPGDSIYVAAGTYTGVSDRNGTTQLVYIDKTLIIKGGYDSTTWAQNPILNPTILDAQGQGHVLVVTGNITPTIQGFHLTNGSAANGGGVYVDTATVSLIQNEIHGNWAEYLGGGIYLKDSTATVAGNHIYTNTTGEAGGGGGLALSNSPATVDDNIIEDNRAFTGGGLRMDNNLGNRGALLTGNTIRNNVAFNVERDNKTYGGAGGGIDTHGYLTDTLTNNIISGNSADWGVASMPLELQPS